MGAPRLGYEKLTPRKPDKLAARVEWLRRLYIDHRLTTVELGRLFDVDHKSIHKMFHDANRYGNNTERQFAAFLFNGF